MGRDVIRWAVLGATSRIYRDALLPAFDQLDGHRVVAEASRHGDDLGSYAEVIGRQDVDAIYIPLPNHLHLPWIERSLAAGKHVLCEKPIGLTLAEAEAAFQAARQADRWLIEAYMWPHHPRSRRTLELVADGVIGDLRFLHGSFTYDVDPTDHRADQRGGGVVLDVGIYCIAPAMLMAGCEPQRVHATAVRNTAGVDTAMSGFVDWGAGFVSSFEVCLDAPGRRTMELVGTTGIMTFPHYHHAGIDGPAPIIVERRDGRRVVFDVDDSNGYRGMVKQFASVIHGEQPPVYGERESLRLARILDAAHRDSLTSPSAQGLSPDSPPRSR